MTRDVLNHLRDLQENLEDWQDSDEPMAAHLVTESEIRTMVNDRDFSTWAGPELVPLMNEILEKGVSRGNQERMAQLVNERFGVKRINAEQKLGCGDND